MIKHITAFVLDGIKGTDEARVRMRVKWEGSRSIVAVNVGYRVNIYKWDAEAQRCVPRSFHGDRKVPAAQINAELDRYYDAAEAAMRACDGCPSAAEFREALNTELGRTAPEELGVFQAFDKFTAERGERNRWTPSTYTKMQAVRRHLREFCPSLTWADFNEDGLYRYVAHLRTSTPPRGKSQEGRPGLSDSTVEKQIGFLKWFLKWADIKGLLPSRDYIAFKPKLQSAEKPVVFLEWEELMTVYNWEFTQEQAALARVRDVFCFCAFTSLRYSDVASLRWSDVFDDYITVTTQKTTDSLVIELNRYSQELLSRYVDEAYPDDKVFPVISNQKMNEHLKEVMRLCGIVSLIRVTSFRDGRREDKFVPKWKLVGTHAARRTFICNALMMGIAPNVVMRWTGHADYSSMKPYIAIADSFKAAEMLKFDKK
jgi:integrase